MTPEQQSQLDGANQRVRYQFDQLSAAVAYRDALEREIEAEEKAGENEKSS